MNCANHSEASVEAFCQQCGKALCSKCVRTVSGIVYCEPCLAARLGIPAAGAPASSYAGNMATGSVPPSGPYSGDARPGLAGFLGAIPGVGAMYNGQFVKGLVHVLVFVILVTIADEHGPFGIFIAAWFFYQIFDAYQTAKARRDGLSLPDPFGLNDLGARLGLHPAQSVPVPPAAAQQASYEPTAFPAAASPPAPESQSAYSVPFAPVPPMPPIPPMPRASEPVGAIVLIALGVLFLLSSLGIFSMRWIGHGWPILLIILGGWLIFRRTREIPNGGIK